MIRIMQRATWAVLALAGSAPAAVLHVPGDYDTPQAAVDAGAPGDRIVIGPGSYDHVRIHERTGIHLVGQGRPVVGDPDAWQAMLVSNSTDITIEGIAFVGDDDEPGLSIQDSRRVTVRRCRARGLHAGIHVLDSQDVVIERNLIRDTMHGIALLMDEPELVEERDRSAGGPIIVRHNRIMDSLIGIFVNVSDAEVENNWMVDVQRPLGGLKPLFDDLETERKRSASSP